jgi:hypothetical protein
MDVRFSLAILSQDQVEMFVEWDLLVVAVAFEVLEG